MPLTDAFVADRTTVAAISDSTVPVRDLAAVDVKGVDIVKLGKLRSILADKPFTTVLPEFPEVHAVSDDGPWIFEISPALIASLAQMKTPEAVEFAKRWATIQEFQLDGFDLSAGTSVLQQFVLLAQQAQTQAKGVYLWSSL